MRHTPPDISGSTAAAAGPGGSLADNTPEAEAAAEEALARFIQQRINFERLPTERYGLSDFKLGRMRSLLNRLGNPQLRPAVHIAGTKGKGSTAAMTAGILQASGHRVGLFTSPHVTHFSERMTVDGIRPNSAELLALLEELQPAVDAMDREGESRQPTFFEVLTAMAWLHFRNRDVDLVVLETGLGGRLDATNVCQPAVCVITSISRDHERLLGSTLSQIAWEKAGILKTGVPVISGVCDDDPREVIRSVAEDVGAERYELGTEVLYQSATEQRQPADCSEPQFARIDVRTPWRRHRSLTSPLAGDHQAANLALAVAASDCLGRAGWTISDAAMATGLERVICPLRVEVVHRRPLVVVDAAHNAASVAALASTIGPVRAAERVLVFGTARDKDSAGMLAEVAGSFDRVILTRFVNNPRAVSQPQLQALAEEHLQIPWDWADDPQTAWQLASRTTDADDLICATGSFFLAAEFREAVGAGAE